MEIGDRVDNVGVKVNTEEHGSQCYILSMLLNYVIFNMAKYVLRRGFLNFN